MCDQKEGTMIRAIERKNDGWESFCPWTSIAWSLEVEETPEVEQGTYKGQICFPIGHMKPKTPGGLQKYKA